MPITLIVGLGNPGADYVHTRHNAGFWLVDQLAQRFHAGFTPKKKLCAALARIQTQIKDNHHDVQLIKPQTYMNDSGRAVRMAADYYAHESDAILIVHDEIDLPAGAIKLKKGGGHGGHNGLRSISEQLPDSGYYRLRIGIGHPGDKQNVTAHVLGAPGHEDKQRIDAAIGRGLDVMGLIISGELAAAMNRLHGDN